MPEEAKKTKKIPKDYLFAVGRRKEAVARVRIYKSVPDTLLFDGKKPSKGQMYVNGIPIARYFNGKTDETFYKEPLRVINVLEKYVISIKVAGGGQSGQLDASIHGLARALEKIDKEKFRPILKKRGFLTRDQRTRERRKAGTAGKARRQKSSPKR